KSLYALFQPTLLGVGCLLVWDTLCFGNGFIRI
ncbi:MAG: hypothetical protein ACI8PD_000562, partial [Nitrospinales bacterium]